MGVLEIFIGVIEIFDSWHGDISSVRWRYMIGVLEIFGRCPGDI